MAKIENVRTKKKKDAFMQEYKPPVNDKVHPLDSDDAKKKLLKLKDWWYQAQEQQADNRVEMAIDEGYYDGDQWTEEEKTELTNRGQAPVVFNRIKTTVNWVLGAQSRAKIDYKVVSRKKEEVETAQAKTELLKYVEDVNNGNHVRARAFKDAAIAGVGWIETGIRSDPTEEALYARYENWRNIWYDHLSVEPDMSDGRFLFRAKWVDLDIAQAMFPDRAAALEVEAENVSQLFPWMPDDPIIAKADAHGTVSNVDETMNVFYRRRRVRLIECWYKEIANVKVVRGDKGILNGAIVTDDPYIQEMIAGGYVSVYDAIKTVMRCAVFCGSTFLQDQISPYRHQTFPFSPIWCYRRGKDNAPYGIIRDLRDIQDDLNKRRSKALYLLSTNRIIADDNATDDWQSLYDEANRPDGIVKKRPGSEVKIEQGAALASYHVELAQEDAQMIQDIAGVTDENMGRDTNATSGKAVRARQEQGFTTNNFIFDNLWFAVKSTGEKELSLIEQYYSEEKSIRLVSGSMGRLNFVDINKRNEDGSILNDITSSKADFSVSKQDYRDSMRQAMFETMMEMTSRMSPEIALNLLDMIVDLSDLPNKDEMVTRIRQLNGQKDPERDMSDPEVIAEEQARAQIEAQQKEMQDRLMVAEIAIKEADAALKTAQADKSNSESTAKAVEALYSAIQTALIIVQTPGVSTVADSIAKSAGYVDKDAAPIIPQYSGGGIGEIPIQEQNTSPMFPPRTVSPGQGMMQGIEA